MMPVAGGIARCTHHPWLCGQFHHELAGLAFLCGGGAAEVNHFTNTPLIITHG